MAIVYLLYVTGKLFFTSNLQEIYQVPLSIQEHGNSNITSLGLLQDVGLLKQNGSTCKLYFWNHESPKPNKIWDTKITFRQ